MLEEPRDLPTREEFEKYERVRREGRFNMFSSEAMELSGLRPVVYSKVMKHYTRLCEMYPDVRV